MIEPTKSASIHARAPAKINLGLHVLRRRTDSFHDVETVMLPIGWHDTLTVEPAPSFRFTCSDTSLPTDERNLCVRAAHSLAATAGIKPRGHLHLEKHIPHGAGLGGGSSDAAYTLRLLSRFWGLRPEPSELHGLAAALGSDVPFFLYDEAMVATGRGEQLDPLTNKSYRLPYTLAVVMPPVHVSTAEAYSLVRPNDRARPDLAAIVRSNDLERWRLELVNDFEAPIAARHPEIRVARQRLQEAGAGFAAMSGSGAAVFGVFEDAEDARRAAEAAEESGHRAWYGEDGS